MASLGATFDATAFDPYQPSEPLPTGRYLLQIISSEMRLTKNGMGQYLLLQLEVLHGEYVGHKLFDRLNLINNNTTAVEIAQRKLSAICRAVGKMQVNDSEELHFLPLMADVKLQPAKDGYGPQNTLHYLPAEQQQPPEHPAASSPPRPAYTPAPSASPSVVGKAPTATPPWRR